MEVVAELGLGKERILVASPKGTLGVGRLPLPIMINETLRTFVCITHNIPDRTKPLETRLKVPQTKSSPGGTRSCLLTWFLFRCIVK